MFNDYFAHAQFVNHTLCNTLKKMAEAVNDTETVEKGLKRRKMDGKGSTEALFGITLTKLREILHFVFSAK